MSDDTLTMAGLMRAFALIPKVRRLRMIVGAPGFQVDAIYKYQTDNQTIFFVGIVAYGALRRAAPVSIDPDPMGSWLSLWGMRVEFYGDRDDHVFVLRETTELMLRGLLLRVALDEEFGNTDPRLR